MNVEVKIFCIECGLDSPFEGCDANGCKWRENAFIERVRMGAPVTVVCDETNNSAEDTSSAKLTVELIAGSV